MKRGMLIIISIFYSWLLWSQTVKIGTGSYEPFTSDQMVNKGYASELTVLIFEAAGLDFEFSFHPWLTVEEYLQQGLIDIAMPYGYTHERAEKYLYSNVLFHSYTVLFYHMDNTLIRADLGRLEKAENLYDNIDLFSKYKIGGLSGYFYEPYLFDQDINYLSVSDSEELLRMLETGSLDLILFTQTSGYYLLDKVFPDKTDDFKVLCRYDSYPSIGNYFIASRNNPVGQILLDQLNKGLEEIVETGEYATLINKYKMIGAY